jgi:hypothetical protein
MTRSPEEPIDAWQADVTELSRMPVEMLRARAARLARRTRVRNYGGYATSAIVVTGALWWMTRIADPFATVGALLIMAGALTMAAQLRATRPEGWTAGRAAALGRTASFDFHRADLERQRDFHRGAQLWIRLGVFAPGALLFFAGFARAYPHLAETIGWEALASVLLLGAAVPLNAWYARDYQRQIDALDHLRKDQS